MVNCIVRGDGNHSDVGDYRLDYVGQLGAYCCLARNVFGRA